ncbi:hypothetical protein [Burkholderia cepacia]|nr:hypothetical protein [Burkholderia cepacia]
MKDNIARPFYAPNVEPMRPPAGQSPSRPHESAGTLNVNVE